MVKKRRDDSAALNLTLDRHLQVLTMGLIEVRLQLNARMIVADCTCRLLLTIVSGVKVSNIWNTHLSSYLTLVPLSLELSLIRFQSESNAVLMTLWVISRS